MVSCMGCQRLVSNRNIDERKSLHKDSVGLPRIEQKGNMQLYSAVRQRRSELAELEGKMIKENETIYFCPIPKDVPLRDLPAVLVVHQMKDDLIDSICN